MSHWRTSDRAFGLVSPLEDQTGDGGFEKTQLSYLYPTPGGPSIGGYVEFLNGNTSQLLVETTVPYNPLTNAGDLISTARRRVNDPGLPRAPVGVLLRHDGLVRRPLGKPSRLLLRGLELSRFAALPAESRGRLQPR
jgi:hypothetical protein